MGHGGMGHGVWGMENGEWKTENGKRKPENGRELGAWSMENGEWKPEKGEGKPENGRLEDVEKRVSFIQKFKGKIRFGIGYKLKALAAKPAASR